MQIGKRINFKKHVTIFFFIVFVFLIWLFLFPNKKNNIRFSFGIQLKDDDDVIYYHSTPTLDGSLSCAIVSIDTKNIDDFLKNNGGGIFFTAKDHNNKNEIDKLSLYIESNQPKNLDCFHNAPVEQTTFSHPNNIIRVYADKGFGMFDIEKKILWLHF